MIRVEKVTKYYPTFKGLHYVLRDASVEIPARAQIGVLGRNGTGKSTLMRMLAGVDVPNRGRIIKWGSVSWPLGIANGVQSQMTGRENTRFACRIQGLHYDEMAPIIEFVQSFADIGAYFDEPARVYSSGMRARVGFAITMAFDFDFYIIDELTAVGDVIFKEKARQVFQEKRLKAGFVRASHSTEELRAECDSGIVIHDAKLEYWPTIDEAIDRYLSLAGTRGDGGGREKRARKARRSQAHSTANSAGDSVAAGAEPSSKDRELRRALRAAKRKGRPGKPDASSLQVN
jgi:capsular polysaccharide transport system ATP-binding protein